MISQLVIGEERMETYLIQSYLNEKEMGKEEENWKSNRGKRETFTHISTLTYQL